jgi:pyruvate/2-oxoglutarate dehydrogenase complex dihydrolipoamide acyltransferase (E2) component
MDMAVMDDAVKLRTPKWHKTFGRLYRSRRQSVKALRGHPLMNSVFSETKFRCDDIHVGIAVAIDAGLVVPVNPQRRSAT